MKKQERAFAFASFSTLRSNSAPFTLLWSDRHVRMSTGTSGSERHGLHLMIAGRLHWKPAHAALKGRQNLAAFDFPPGSLTLTEAGSKRRASLHVVAVLADRGLSRLLGADWPRTLDELEDLRRH